MEERYAIYITNISNAISTNNNTTILYSRQKIQKPNTMHSLTHILLLGRSNISNTSINTNHHKLHNAEY